MEWMPRASRHEPSQEGAEAQPRKPALDLSSRLSWQSMGQIPAMISAAIFDSLQTDAEAQVLQMLEHGLDQWEFDSLRLDALTGGHALQAIGWAFCKRYSLPLALDCSAETLLRFFGALEEGYHANPYHNAAHAACVAHGVHFLARHAELQGLVSGAVEMFTCLLAALAHDLGHSGQNNAFHVASSSELALLYSDQSVLEMHHLARCFTLLREKETAVLANLEVEKRKEVRAKTIAMVLATDLAVNFQVLNSFKQMLEEKALAASARKARRGRWTAGEEESKRPRGTRTTTISSSPGSEQAEEPEGWMVETFTAAEKLLVLKMLLKVSDIGNVTKGKGYCIEWTHRVTEEFLAQGDLEGELQLPVTPFMDRKSANTPKQQLGFYNFIAKPMFEAMNRLVRMDKMISNLDEMVEHWSSQLPPAEAPGMQPASPQSVSFGDRAKQRRSSRTSRMSNRILPSPQLSAN
mmetsp:Transcript_44244/g.109960  ORF Transcript_44244/g.109960 Transcript_44244/m.109960 type:complete len:465 (+) Transcript_44244:470-1864(+)